MSRESGVDEGFAIAIAIAVGDDVAGREVDGVFAAPAEARCGDGEVGPFMGGDGGEEGFYDGVGVGEAVVEEEGEHGVEDAGEMVAGVVWVLVSGCL